MAEGGNELSNGIVVGSNISSSIEVGKGNGKVEDGRNWLFPRYPHMTDKQFINSLPHGFRFMPKDEELIIDFLKKKVNNQELDTNRIKEDEVYSCNPDELINRHEKDFKEYKENVTEWYFFSPRNRKYANGRRPDRAAGDGYWKATGSDKKVKLITGETIGSKRTLVFYKGRSPTGEKSNWLMQEYVLDNDTRKRTHDGDMKLNEWVLCKVYRNKSGKEENGTKSSQIHTSSQVGQSHQGFNSNDVQTFPMPVSSARNNGNDDPGFQHFNQPSSSGDSSRFMPKPISIKFSQHLNIQQQNQQPLLRSIMQQQNQQPLLGSNVQQLHGQPLLGSNVQQLHGQPLLGSNVQQQHGQPYLGNQYLQRLQHQHQQSFSGNQHQLSMQHHQPMLQRQQQNMQQHQPMLQRQQQNMQQQQQPPPFSGYPYQLSMQLQVQQRYQQQLQQRHQQIKQGLRQQQHLQSMQQEQQQSQQPLLSNQNQQSMQQQRRDQLSNLDNQQMHKQPHEQGDLDDFN